MKRFLTTLLVVTLFASACSHSGGSGVKLRSDADSMAYILGMNVGMNLWRVDSTLHVEALCKGIYDVYKNKTALSVEEARAYYLRYINYTLPEKARAYEEQFLADIAKSNRSYARTTSGVTYTVEELGDQNEVPASERDTVTVRWVIRTTDGVERYSSYERGDTLRMALSELVSGVRESVKLIGKGGRIHTWLPAREAYGAEGNEEMHIEPNSTLYYEIELIELDKYSNKR